MFCTLYDSRFARCMIPYRRICGVPVRTVDKKLYIICYDPLCNISKEQRETPKMFEIYPYWVILSLLTYVRLSDSLIGVYDNSWTERSVDFIWCVIIFSLHHYFRNILYRHIIFWHAPPNKLFILIEMHITVIPLNIDTYHIVFGWVKIRTIRLDSSDTSRANS